MGRRGQGGWHEAHENMRRGLEVSIEFQHRPDPMNVFFKHQRKYGNGGVLQFCRCTTPNAQRVLTAQACPALIGKHVSQLLC